MKQRDIRLGGCYAVRVSGALVAVRIVGVLGARPGRAIQWVGRSLHTGRTVQLTARRAQRALSLGESMISEGTRSLERRVLRRPVQVAKPGPSGAEVRY